ncbi:MAG: glycosyl hydrolase, partial [Novosphingobium sp.]
MTKAGLKLMVAAFAMATALAAGAGVSQPAKVPSPAPANSLEAQFFNPPQSARPRVWWHWMNGNVTRDGIAKDLAWLKSVGIGGVQNFDANLDTPQVVPKRLIYMQPDWKDAFRFALSEADRQGLEFAIAASPGWSVTGGPWVKPQDGMKKLVWGETLITGGKRFTGKLAAAPDATGPYQDLPYFDAMPGGGTDGPKAKASGTIAVLAMPMSAATLPVPTYALSDGTALPTAPLTDANFASAAAVPVAADKSAIVSVTYTKPVTVRSLRLFIPGLKLPFRGVQLGATLEARDATGWKAVGAVPISSVPTTQAIPATTAREFRLVLQDSQENSNLDLLGAVPGAIPIDFFNTGPLKSVQLADLQLFAETRVGRAEEKAGYETVLDYYAIGSADGTPSGFGSGDVIDLSNRVKPDGTLDWTPPKGRDWRVLRFGWSLTGKVNHPATPEATGLEVDKYDGAAVRRYLETYLGMYRETAGGDLFGQRGLKALLTDSIEVG